MDYKIQLSFSLSHTIVLVYLQSHFLNFFMYLSHVDARHEQCFTYELNGAFSHEVGTSCIFGKYFANQNGLRTCQILSLDSASAQDDVVQLSQAERMRALFPTLSRTICECEHGESTSDLL